MTDTPATLTPPTAERLADGGLIPLSHSECAALGYREPTWVGAVYDGDDHHAELAVVVVVGTDGYHGVRRARFARMVRAALGGGVADALWARLVGG